MSTERAGTGAGKVHELRISELRAGVAGREVLRGVDLTIRGGEVHAVMGPNGSGKSTLAHVIMGRPGYEVLGGSVTLDGTELLGLPAWKRARLGLFLAPQDPIEVPGVSLAGVIGEALAARRSPAAAAAATTATSLAEATTLLAAAEKVLLAEAQKVGLDPTFLERAVNVELSGGERKRSEVLQLGVLTPAFAVLDELDSGLDVDGLRAVGKRVHESVSEWGAGVLAITHYRRLLSVIHPDAVHVLVEGRIVASGGAELAEELERTGYSAYTGVDAANQT